MAQEHTVDYFRVLAFFITPVWKRQEGSKNLQRISTPWGLLGGQYEAFQAIFEILQHKYSETSPDFHRKNKLLCQNMSLKASNPLMIVQHVAWNNKIHNFFKLGAILFTIVDFSIFHFGQRLETVPPLPSSLEVQSFTEPSGPLAFLRKSRSHLAIFLNARSQPCNVEKYQFKSSAFVWEKQTKSLENSPVFPLTFNPLCTIYEKLKCSGNSTYFVPP